MQSAVRQNSHDLLQRRSRSRNRVLMQKKWTISLDEVKKSKKTIHQFILDKTDISHHIQNLNRKKHPIRLSKKIDIPVDHILREINQFKKKSPSKTFEVARKKSYRYLPITQHNSYLYKTFDDSMSFTTSSSLTDMKNFKNLLSCMKRQVIKSRVAIILGQQEESHRQDYLWHKDESVFFNLRVNIPIQTSENYRLQIIDEQASDSRIFYDFCLEDGTANIFNSEMVHRAYCRKKEMKERIHLMIGCSPWFDFDVEQGAWISNQYYGKIHPFEMFQKNLIFSTQG